MFFFKRKFGWEKHFVGFICFAYVNERHLCLLVCDTFWNMLVIFVWPAFNVIFFSLSLSSLSVTREVMAILGIYHVFAFGVKSMTKYGQKSLMTTEPPSDSLLLWFQSISNGNMKIACTIKWVSTIAGKWVELLNFALLIFVGVKCKFAQNILDVKCFWKIKQLIMVGWP